MTETDVEFRDSAFEVGDTYGSQGMPLSDAVACVERELDRPMDDGERSQLLFGWYYGRADFEARVERQQVRPDCEPVAVDDIIPF